MLNIGAARDIISKMRIPSNLSTLYNPSNYRSSPSTQSSIIQRLLPSITSLIGICIFNHRDARYIQIQNQIALSIDGHTNRSIHIGLPAQRKRHQILLHRQRNCLVDDTRARPIEVRVRHVFAVVSWWKAESIAVRIRDLSKCLLQEASVASNCCVGHLLFLSIKVAGVRLGTIKHLGLECVRYVVHDRRLDIRERLLEPWREDRIVGVVRTREAESFIGIEGSYGFDWFIEGALSKEQAGQCGSKSLINSRCKSESTIRGSCYNCNVGSIESLVRELASFVNCRHVDKTEKALQELVLLEVTWERLERRGLEYGLLEGSRTGNSTKCRNLMHDRTSACGLAEGGDTSWVATEELDVTLHPFKSKPLI